MNLFNIFSKKKKMSLKELYAPVLDKMWVCVVNFCPWDSSRHNVVFKQVGIVRAEADSNGIYVTSHERDPFSSYSEDYLAGYVDKITIRGCHCCGFFETEDGAKKAYNGLMNDWIDVIKSKLVV